MSHQMLHRYYVAAAFKQPSRVGMAELVERSVRDAGAICYGLEASEQMTDSAAVSVAEDPLRLSRQLFQ